MSERIKTVVFLGSAVVVVAVATFVWYPRQADVQTAERVGKTLFPDFKNVQDATELRIVRFTEGVGEWSEFKVARNSTTGLWTIPSSSNYPADAEKQMGDAATALVDLRILDVASERSSDHEIYGVIEPNREKLEASQEGVGLFVSVKDAKGKDLAKMIVGKAVKGATDQRFVRVPGQNLVYVAQIDPEKFPTTFEKWIEPDLLKLVDYDVDRVKLRDYSILTTTNPLTGQLLLDKFEQRLEADIDWDRDKSEWKLGKLAVWRGGERKETTLLETEELNRDKLNDLKKALSELKIVDVRRKPDGLGADLKAGDDIMNNNDSRVSLMNRGFFPISLESGPAELRAANGEVLIGTKDGVEYVLRFGKIESVDEKSEEGKLNRFLFVTARIDEATFPPLQLEQLPADPAKPEDTKTDPATTEVPKTEEPKTEEPKTEEPKTEEPKTEEPKTEEPKTEEPKTEEPKTEEGQSDPKDAATETAKDDSVAKKSDLELERERITKENQRKIDERDEALKKANKKVRELNARFADWYYVISEDVYKRIHLGRNDLIKEKDSAKDEGFGVDALRKREEEGLKKKDDSTSSFPSTPGSTFMPPLE